MARLAAKKQSWQLTTAAPPREIFASMEQMIGTPPYRFEPVDHDTARILQFERRRLFGGWTKAKRRQMWVTCKATDEADGTAVVIEASQGRAPRSRALQLVHLLTTGIDDRRTIYRSRVIAPGPISLVASWAGTPYALFKEPSFDAPRGTEIFTATHVQAIDGGKGSFVKVQLADGTQGFVERDQIVPAPEIATREAQAAPAAQG